MTDFGIFFYLTIPDEDNYTLNAICAKMNITNNPRITNIQDNITPSFCGDTRMSIKNEYNGLTSTLKTSIAIPDSYTLYLYEDAIDGDDEDNGNDYQISDLFAVMNFSLIGRDKIKINMICSNRSYSNKGYASMLINKLFDAVQTHVDETNQQMSVVLTPVSSATRFYEKVGMTLLKNRDMHKTFISRVQEIHDLFSDLDAYGTRKKGKRKQKKSKSKKHRMTKKK